MNNKEPVDTLPNSVLDKHRIHVGNFKEGDYLLGNNDGTIYGVSTNIQIDRIDGLEARLAKERIDTEKDISNVYSWTSEKIFKLKDTIKEDQELNKKRFTEMYKNIIDLEDTVRSNRITKEDEIEHIHKILFWVSTVAFIIMGFLSFSVIYLFNKI